MPIPLRTFCLIRINGTYHFIYLFFASENINPLLYGATPSYILCSCVEDIIIYHHLLDVYMEKLKYTFFRFEYTAVSITVS